MSKMKGEAQLQYEKKIAAAQDKNALLVEELRVINREHLTELKTNDQYVAAMKGDYEKKIETTMLEAAELHELLAKNNTSSEGNIQKMATERDSYDEIIRDLTTKLNDSKLALLRSVA